MKIIHVLFLCCTLFILSCGNNNNSSVKEAARNSLSVSDSDEPAPVVNTAITPDSAEPPQNADGVWHYVCVNACEGIGSGGAGTCPNCGGEMTHNAEYHNNDKSPLTTATTPVTPPAGLTQAVTGAAGGAAANATFTPPPTAPEPPQNSKGVWHYTCAAGCAGGAGAAGTCNKCGGELAHNAAYHN